ncbi:MAG: hypothetical protein FJ109_04595 [Deltaproteobacteria bacterium]|nr:hypothetical protein [Deltaproteobacteria bacterium]
MAWLAGSIAWGVCVGLLVAGIRGTAFRREDLPYWLLGAAVLLLCLVLVLDPSRGYTFVVDDAYYYLQIARNVDVRGLVSFDGIHETNGFHPLWLCMLVVLHRAVPAGDAEFVTAAQLAALLLAAGGIVWLRLLLSPLAGSAARVMGLLVLFNPWALSRFWLSGMESAVAVLILLAFLEGWRRLCDSRDFGLLLRTSLLGGLACLARFDLVLLVFPALILLAWRWMLDVGLPGSGGKAPGRAGPASAPRRLIEIASPSEAATVETNGERARSERPSRAVAVRRLLGGALACSIPVGAWLVWNLARFGTVSTVSSHVKTAVYPMSLVDRFDNLCLVLPSLKFLVDVSVLRVLSPLALAAVAWAAWRLGRSVAPGAARSAYRFLAVIACIHYLAVRGGVAESYSWYYLIETLLAAHVAAMAVQRLTGLVPRANGLARAVVAAAAVISGLLVRDLVRGEPVLFVSRAIQSEGRTAAEWIREHTPPDAVVASWDAGILGYFAHRPVINLDGLANDWEYVGVMKNRAWNDYLERSGVGYVANWFFVLEDSRLWRQRIGMAEVLPTLRLEYRGREVPFLRLPVAVAVFRRSSGEER